MMIKWQMLLELQEVRIGERFGIRVGEEWYGKRWKFVICGGKS